MGNKKKKGSPIGFEVLEFDENSVVYKRVISSRLRNEKDNEIIALSLPKVTMHCFSIEEYNKLKIIEDELRNEMLLLEPKSKFFLRILELFR